MEKCNVLNKTVFKIGKKKQKKTKKNKKLTFFSPVATTQLSKFAGILSAAL